MIIAVDIETYVKEEETYKAILNSNKFYCGVITYENLKSEIYYNKNELWWKIINLGLECAKKGSVLNVYAHNHAYDFYGYANWKDKNIRYRCDNPFIAGYVNNEGKEIIKFLDTMGIHKTSLKKIGELIGLEKLELPLEFKEKNKKELEKYVTRDGEIIIKAIENIKEFLKKENIHIKRIYTISQIAIAYMINKLKKETGTEEIIVKNGRNIERNKIFMDKSMGKIWWTKNTEEIHLGYKGGRVEALQTGIISRVSSIDINSLYPYSLKTMRFPDLRTEMKIKGDKENLEYIGISKCMITNKSCEHGLLQIRKEENNWILKKGQTGIGTWTHEEIKTAINNGHELKAIEYSIIYQDMTNPFENIINNLYELKETATSETDRNFYKGILNRSIGKFGQRRANTEIIIDNCEKQEEYLKKGYEMKRGFGYDIMYQKTEENIRRNYYCPIIPTLVNGYSRAYLYKEMKKIPIKDIIYIDTDSIKFKGNHFNKFEINNKLGKWKKEFENEEMIVYGNKTYMIGEEIKVSGFHKKYITKENFIEGKIKDNKIVSIKTANEKHEVGEQQEEFRDLNEQQEKHEEETIQNLKKRIHIDNDIEDIDYFVKYINMIN